MMRPPAPLPSELPQTGPAREHLRQARRHLDLARDLLDRPTPEYQTAAVHVATCYQSALSAVTTWNRVRLSPEADLREIGGRAIHFASMLQTPVSRALAMLPLLRTIGGKRRLDVHDREGVDTGWYTARNLYRTVVGELPAGVRTGHVAAAPLAEPSPTDRRRELRGAIHVRQEREPAVADRAVPAPHA